MADQEKPARTLGQGLLQAFDGRQIQVIGRLIHDDKMWHIGDPGGKKNFPNLVGTGCCALQLGFLHFDAVHFYPGSG